MIWLLGLLLLKLQMQGQEEVESLADLFSFFCLLNPLACAGDCFRVLGSAQIGSNAAIRTRWFGVRAKDMLVSDWLSRQKVATSTTPPGPGQPNQVVGQPYTFYVTSSYHAGPCEASQWTTFDTTANDVPTVRNLIASGNPDPAAVGSPGGVCSTPDNTCTYIQPGTKTTLYSSVNACSAAGTKACEYVLVPIVQDLTTSSYERILAFACVHIDGASGGSAKYIQMEMSNNPDKCQASGAGGIGTNYGAYSPARLVE